jgi:hypothetical protein
LSVARAARPLAIPYSLARGSIIAPLPGRSARLPFVCVDSMNKMRFKALAAAVAVGGLFFAPGSVVQASAQQQVQLFHRLPDAKAAALKDLVERFNAQSKDVQVVLSAVDWRSGGAAPDDPRGRRRGRVRRRQAALQAAPPAHEGKRRAAARPCVRPR